MSPVRPKSKTGLQRFGGIRWDYLDSLELKELRVEDRAAYGFLLHLYCRTMLSQDTYRSTVAELARDLGVNRRTVRRWSESLEARQLVERQVEAQTLGAEYQEWRLLEPASVDGTRQIARTDRDKLRAQLQAAQARLESLESSQDASRFYEGMSDAQLASVGLTREEVDLMQAEAVNELEREQLETRQRIRTLKHLLGVDGES